MITPRAVNYLSYCLAVLVGLALLLLGARAVVRLEMYWDTFWYHIPFAAMRGGLGVPFELSSYISWHYEGFPPLPHLVQGILWRLSGSVNATGTINYLAFALYLAYGHFALGAPFWLVGAVALTAPLILIHLTTSYVDLFANSLLAIGVTSLAKLHLSWHGGLRLWYCGLAGLTAAAWSKYQMVPLTCLLLVLYGCWLRGRRSSDPRKRRGQAASLVLAVLIVAAPYVKNLIIHRNPFWPFRLPVASAVFPFTVDSRVVDSEHRPPPLVDSSQPTLFLHSLLEVNHPTNYPNRYRWIVDQGQAWLAYRMGGFWNVAVVIFLGFVGVFLWLRGDRNAWQMAVAMLGVLYFVAVLPQSHNLRYYLFLPLSWAALLGMLVQEARARRPILTAAVLTVVLSLFLYSGALNTPYYRIERIGYHEAAVAWGAAGWWSRLVPGVTYCAQGMEPIGIMLTGPTMTEFRIVDRRSDERCPPGSVVLRNP
jgi:hypothetical protein